MRKPCENCPWRVDAPRDYWDPEHFRQIWRNCQDDGIHVMLCHKSNNRRQLEPGSTETARVDPNQPVLVCQGWARVMRYDAIGVRLAVLRGQLTDDEIFDTSRPELFPTFEQMLRANKIRLPARNTFLPRKR